MKTARIVLAVIVCGFFVTSGATSARADDAAPKADESKKPAARALYDQARRAYDVGDWDEAIRLFQASYQTYPFRNVLFDLGQANRHAGKCKQAVFFYKRFLQLKPDAANRSEVERFISTCEKAQDGARSGGDSAVEAPKTSRDASETNAGGAGDNQTSVAAAPDTGDSAVGDSAGGDSSSGGVAVSATPGAEQPSLLVATAQAGPAFVGVFEGQGASTHTTFSLGLAYPLRAGPVGIEAGLLVGYTLVPWETADMAVTGDLGLLSLTAGAGVTFEVVGRLSIRGELGLGDLVVLGLDEPNNPFTETELGAAENLFHVRVAVGAEYAVSDNLVVTAHPLAFMRAWRIDGLAQNVPSLTQLSIIAGLSYRR